MCTEEVLYPLLQIQFQLHTDYILRDSTIDIIRRCASSFSTTLNQPSLYISLKNLKYIKICQALLKLNKIKPISLPISSCILKIQPLFIVLFCYFVIVSLILCIYLILNSVFKTILCFMLYTYRICNNMR